MKYITLTLLLTQLLFAGEKAYRVENFDCVEIARETYTGSPDSLGGRFNSDGLLTYEFDEPILLKGIGDTCVYAQAKKVKIQYWDNGWHSKNVSGQLYKPVKKFPLIGKKEKKKVEAVENAVGKSVEKSIR